MPATLNFWESFALSTGISALTALLGQSAKLTPEQKADIGRGLQDLQQIQADFQKP
jgi:hypothetical protein